MNTAEYEALDTEWLPNEARVLYLMHLRRKMCYRTGVVGRVPGSRVSYQSMREAIRVDRRRGSRKASYRADTRELRYLIELLEKVGLLFRLDGELQFRLPLATYDLNQANEERHSSGTVQGAVNKSTTLDNTGVSGFSGVDERQRKSTEERQTTVLPSKNSLSAPQDRKFQMVWNWSPFSGDRFAEACAMAGVCWDNLGTEQKELIRVEFVRFWMAERCEASQGQWEHRFINSIGYQVQRGAGRLAQQGVQA